VRYAREDIPTLHRYISGTFFYNMNDRFQYGAFLNLVQHHGYPTPLLDWTFSPYIAAYFAFKDVNPLQKENIRIYVLNAQDWQNDTDQVYSVEAPVIALTIQELLPINNNRAIPQQSITTFSTVYDIEKFILEKEGLGKRYLEIIEIPCKEKNDVMEDLAQMGITESSLFPGIDGICRTLKNLHFPENIASINI
jgi:hypothetical protein